MTGSGFDAVVLAGGLARRLDGTDKPALSIGGVTLLDRVLEACADAADVVCVGPPRPTRSPVRWTREDPPGSGPGAALIAGLALGHGAGARPYVLVLAADLPLLTRGLVHSLWTAACGHDGAVLEDSAGREQWLAACYQREALAGRVEQIRGEGGGTAGLSLRRLVAQLDLVRVADPEGGSFDCDTWEDVNHVRRLVERDDPDRRPPGPAPER